MLAFSLTVICLFVAKTIDIKTTSKEIGASKYKLPSGQSNFALWNVKNFEERCRPKTLKTLFAFAKNGTVDENNGSVREAKKCWMDALIFYLNYPLEFSFGSHILPLVASLWITDGPILEMGSGWYSTPVFHRISLLQRRRALTAESNYQWLQHFFFFASDYHHIYYVNVSEDATPGLSDNINTVYSWDDIGNQIEDWDVVFIDQAPALRRKIDMERIRARSKLILVHDTEPRAYGIYQTHDILITFKARASFGEGWTDTYTDLVSDTHPEMVSAAQVLCNWGIELIKTLNN